MVQFVENSVREIADTPSANAEIELVVGYAEDSTGIKRMVEAEGGSVVEDLPIDAVVVTVPETAIERVIEHDQTETVETNDGGETFGQRHSFRLSTS